jgi:hypothetical protein
MLDPLGAHLAALQLPSVGLTRRRVVPASGMSEMHATTNDTGSPRSDRGEYEQNY